MEVLSEYLGTTYGALTIMESGPFLVLQCENVPPPDSRPFLVADGIAVWLHLNDPLPVGLGFYGDFPNHDRTISLQEDLVADLKPFRLPMASTLATMVKVHFPTANAISYLTCNLVIEFPGVDDEEWRAQLDKLPSAFSNSSVGILYVNGPLMLNSHKRLDHPRPGLLDGVYDDTDYVTHAGCFSPGAMIGSQEGNLTTAGIAVSKGEEIRLTVAIHAWDQEMAEKPGILGSKNDFVVSQGQHDHVANVTSRMGKTDIGLAELHDGIKFCQTFLDAAITPQRLLPFQNVNFRDVMVIDSFVTGTQRLRCLGVRLPISQSRPSRQAQVPGPPPDEPYVTVRQGIYATSAPEIGSMPKIRDGVCGSALIRQETGMPKKVVVAEGEVAGFMGWSNVHNASIAPNELLCFCETADSLIEAGWEVAQLKESTGGDAGMEG
ncbi:MAG: hypothetical protein M1838_001187 [Thelocarpon superellum]|nr:MAG: hypothetical protein M1838_001187 [Thelocarpon superellum]